jgi:FkbM family methyltransferase
LTARLRQPVALHREAGAWVYRWRGATIPHPVIGEALHPEEACAIIGHGYLPMAGDVVFDVGAGVGDTTLLFSKLVGDAGHVVAIEAHPETYGWLVRLCRLNHLTNVTHLQIAASDKDRELLISDERGLTNTIVGDESEAAVAVPARSLDSVAKELGLQEIDLLKMNIEGAERVALLGVQETIRSTRHVCISCHDFMADRGGPEEMRTRTAVIDFLREHGFSIGEQTRGSDSARSYVYGTNRDITPAR